MAKSEKTSKLGFVIKLSSETVQKLAEEEQPAKSSINKEPSTSEDTEPGGCKDPEKPIPSNSHNDFEKAPNLDESKDKSTDKENKSEAEPSIAAEKNESSSNNTNTGNETSSDDAKASWGDYAPYITYEGEEAIYTDPSNQHKYIWDKSTNSWGSTSGDADILGRVYSYEDDKHIYTEPDGSKCFYDAEKKAWIPMVDDDFLAFYQMSYGFVDNTSENQKKKEEESKQKLEKKLEQQLQAGQKRKQDPQWFEQSEDRNTKVYVSNLPEDITEEEFVDLMQKCGLVMRDPSTQKMKVKLYMDKEQNCFKGDALCTYIKIESVELALKLIDGSDYKGNRIKVERAHFQLKGDYNPALKPKKKRKKELEKLKKMQEKLFDWRPEKFAGERSKHERIVILKNVFNPSEFDKEVQLILDYQQDLREECSKCGEVRKVVIYDRHPEGVAQVTMKEPEQADAVVTLLNGRWFSKRQITAEIWDGRTKYRIAETDADINQRIQKWDKFLEGEDKNGKGKGTESTKSAATPGESAKVDTGREQSEPTKVDTGPERSEITKVDTGQKQSETTKVDGQKQSQTTKVDGQKQSETTKVDGQKQSETTKVDSDQKQSETTKEDTGQEQMNPSVAKIENMECEKAN